VLVPVVVGFTLVVVGEPYRGGIILSSCYACYYTMMFQMEKKRNRYAVEPKQLTLMTTQISSNSTIASITTLVKTISFAMSDDLLTTH
jgi:hypothetical protein